MFDDFVNARARLILQLKLVALNRLGSKGFHGSCARRIAAEMVSDGVSQDAIEPAYRAFLMSQLRAVLHELDIRGLQNVLRSCRIADT